MDFSPSPSLPERGRTQRDGNCHCGLWGSAKKRRYATVANEGFVVGLGCDIGGAKEPGVIYFPTNWGAKEPQNLPNHRVVGIPGFQKCHIPGGDYPMT